ncbi:hypothetical protein LUZ60_003462 [Juncus effusus]|nr:hypothetical protein LUZ60_003462 [Juncus effusus]
MAIPTTKTIGDAVLRLQTILLDHGAPSESHLISAACLLSRPDYSDVVTERNISSLCGFPLCSNTLSPSSHKTQQARYRISLSQHKVYDLEERNKFCSEKCLVSSKAYELSLSEKRSFDLSNNKIDSVLKLFEEGGKEELGLGFEKIGDLGKKKKKEVRIVEKEGGINGEMDVDEWIGSAKAIEGYEPKFDRNNKGSKNEMTHQQEMDFRSEIFFDDEPKFDRNKGSKKGLTHQQEMDFRSEIFFDDVFEPKFDRNKGSKNGMTHQQKMDFRSEIFFDDDLSLCQTKDISDEISKKLENTILNEKNNPKKKSNKSSQKPIKNEKKENKFNLKSSFKKNDGSSTSQNRRSVKWADNEQIKSTVEKSTVEKSTDEKSTVEKSKSKVDLRVESAEACVDALIRASESVSLNNSTAAQAVSEAGIVILPPQNHEKKKEYSLESELDKKKEYSLESELEKEKEYSLESELDSLESEKEREITKWPTKPVLLETDAFDTDDSWHDSAPDGFSLTLSPFATIYMSIFSWTTRSTISFIYGHKTEDQNEQLSDANLQKYPCKITIQDGQSAEIRKAMDFFLSLSLSPLVSDLGIPVPVSTLEKNLGFLIDTMSFVEALPSLKTKQWRIIILLFLDALSVFHLPSLAPFLSDRNNISHKVLNGAQISGEEYDTMISHILPLGRI